MTSRQHWIARFGGLALMLVAAAAPAQDWPAWRGPDGNGVAPATCDPPLRWDAKTNVKWRLDLPEPGNSTPIVAKNKVFLTQPLADKNRRALWCVDRSTGKRLWEKSIEWAEPETTHRSNYLCSASPAADERYVVVWYGSAGLYCYDLDGREVWHRDLGKQEHMWGYAASPVIYRNLVILDFGPGNREFLAAFELASGKTVWQIDEPAAPADGDVVSNGPAGLERAEPKKARAELLRGSWATPLVVRAGGRDELVTTLPGRVEGLDPNTGKPLWRCLGLGPVVYTSPVFGEGIVVSLGGYHSPGLAVRPGGEGDVTKTHRVWYQEKSKLRIGTGVIRDGHFYVPTSDGIAHCYELATGNEVWEERLAGSGGKNENWASFTLCGDRIYALNQSGDTFVLRASPDFEILATNSLDEDSNSSVVIAGNEIFLRTHRALWCVSAKAEK